MRFLSAYGKLAPNKLFVSLVFGVVAGILYAALIPIVIYSVSNLPESMYAESDVTKFFLSFDVATPSLASLYFGVCLLILLLRTLSEILLNKVSLTLMMNVRGDLYNKIAKSPISEMEKIGSARIINAMTMDIRRVVDGAGAAPPIIVSSITLISMLIYIMAVDFDLFRFILMVIALGILTYQIPVFIGHKYMTRAVALSDNLQQGFRGLIQGAMELKLNKQKRQHFVENELRAVEKDIRSNSITAASIFALAANYGNLLSFFVIGVLAFILINYVNIGGMQLSSIIMILLYISAPIASILMSVPTIISANISLRRLDEIYKDFCDENVAEGPLQERRWSKLTLRNVCFSYDVSGFKVGPISMDLEKGQVTFIVGGNGSGKSTLSKIITQHYLPVSGEVLFDDVLVDQTNIEDFRQSISAIYSNYFLFKKLYSLDYSLPSVRAQIDEMLVDLQLDQKVSISDGYLSTTELSDGQRRRLALMVALLENKELYLFDEWAADQDPGFRRVFYEKILPSLKERNKAVVVISHDDRFFHHADKLIKLDCGQIVSILKD